MTATTRKLGADMQDERIETVAKALRRAWQLGQTYWQHAGSDSWKQQAKCAAAQKTFKALVDETRTLLACPPATIGGEAATDARIEAAERAAYEVSGHRAGEKWAKAFAEALLANEASKLAAPSVAQDERGAFEQWAATEYKNDDDDSGVDLTRQGDGYLYSGIDDAWNGWKGAWRAGAASAPANVAQREAKS